MSKQESKRRAVVMGDDQFNSYYYTDLVGGVRARTWPRDYLRSEHDNNL